jgi:putative methionine-R-sulfoxide reductase with GAF domain
LHAPVLDNPAKNRIASLQHKILLGLFVTSLLSVFVLFWNWSESTPASLGILFFAMVLFALASFWQRGGHVERASWILIGTIYSILLFSMFRGSFGASAVILAAIIISLAGLLLQPFRVVVVVLITLLSLLIIQYIVPATSAEIDQNQLMFIMLLLGLEGLLLTVASRTLEESFAEADRSTQDLRNANHALQSLTTNLEQRVEERTHDLKLASEVGRTVSEKAKNVSEMLNDAVEMIRARFNLYYTQIYLTDSSGQTIILRAGTGTVGKELVQKEHSLRINSASLNGRAASEKSPVIVTDTNTNPSFLPNPLLPKTRSEMSIPLIVDQKVVGVLDMQGLPSASRSTGDRDRECNLACTGRGSSLRSGIADASFC